jgi:hypothetical protein
MCYYIISLLFICLFASVDGLSSFHVKLSLTPLGGLIHERQPLCQSTDQSISRLEQDVFVVKIDPLVLYDSAVVAVYLSVDLSPSILSDVWIALVKNDLPFSSASSPADFPSSISSALQRHSDVYRLSDFERNSRFISEKDGEEETVLKIEKSHGPIYYHLITFPPAKISQICFGFSKAFESPLHETKRFSPVSRMSFFSSSNSSNSTSRNSRKSGGGVSIIAIVSVAVVVPLAFVFLSVVFYTTIKYVRGIQFISFDEPFLLFSGLQIKRVHSGSGKTTGSLDKHMEGKSC